MSVLRRTSQVLAATLLPSSLVAAGPVTYSVLAVSGQPAPGLTGVTLSALADPRIDDLGRYVFWARLAGTGVSTFNDGSLWTNRSGSLALLLREDSFVSGTSDLFVGLGTPAWSGTGQLALTASIGTGASTYPTNLAQFVETQGAFPFVLRESAQVPVLGLLSLNDAGMLLFRAGDGSSLYSTRSGAAAPIVAAGAPAPGASNPAATFLLLGQAAHNVFGNTVFWATITYPGQTVPESGLWSNAGFPSLIARTGQQAPGLNAGVVFAELDSTPRINLNGDIAFWARVSGPGISASNDGTIWIVTAGAPTLVAREGTSAPGVPNATIVELARHVQLADTGRIFFWGSTAGVGIDASNNSAIWSNDPNAGLALVAREGAQVPGLPAGVNFGVLGRPGTTTAGRVVFTTTLRSTPALAQTTTQALIASDGRGTLYPIARTGDPFAVSAGDTRTIAAITFDQGDPQTGYPQYSSAGILVLKLAFTDNTHALVAARIALCLADFNADGFANGLDFDLFAEAYDAADPSADLNGDTFVNGSDFDLFQEAFDAGC